MVDAFSKLALIALIKDAQIDRILECERSNGAWTMHVQLSFGVQGMGGKFRLQGFLTQEDDGDWLYQHDRVIDDKADWLTPIIQAGNRLTITPDQGATLQPIARPAVKGPAFLPDSEGKHYPLSTDHLRIHAQIVNLPDGFSKKDDWKRLRDHIENHKGPLHALSDETYYVDLDPNQAFFLRCRSDINDDWASVIILRDQNGTIWQTTQDDDDDWNRANQDFQKDSFRFKSTIRWVVETRIVAKTDGRIHYKLRVTENGKS